MDTSLYITFVLVSIGLIIVPGPNVLVIVASSVAHGRTRGLQTVAGTTLAMALQLAIAAAGTGWLVNVLAHGFGILKWMGVVYLLCLGVLHLRQACASREAESAMAPAGTFARGFYVSISNPKTILFFTAFLPQFATAGDHYLWQILILSASFLCLAALLDACYAVLASTLYPVLQRYNVSGIQHGLSGVLLLGAGAWLAATRRFQ